MPGSVHYCCTFKAATLRRCRTMKHCMTHLAAVQRNHGTVMYARRCLPGGVVPHLELRGGETKANGRK